MGDSQILHDLVVTDTTHWQTHTTLLLGSNIIIVPECVTSVFVLFQHFCLSSTRLLNIGVIFVFTVVGVGNIIFVIAICDASTEFKAKAQCSIITDSAAPHLSELQESDQVDSR